MQYVAQQSPASHARALRFDGIVLLNELHACNTHARVTIVRTLPNAFIMWGGIHVIHDSVRAFYFTIRQSTELCGQFVYVQQHLPRCLDALFLVSTVFNIMCVCVEYLRNEIYPHTAAE